MLLILQHRTNSQCTLMFKDAKGLAFLGIFEKPSLRQLVMISALLTKFCCSIPHFSCPPISLVLALRRHLVGQHHRHQPCHCHYHWGDGDDIEHRVRSRLAYLKLPGRSLLLEAQECTGSPRVTAPYIYWSIPGEEF